MITDELGYQQTKTYDSRTVGLSTSELQELKSGGISERVFNLELLFPLSQDENSFVRGLVVMDAVKKNRDNHTVKTKLLQLETHAKSEKNLMPAIIDCVRSECTLGEIADVFRKQFGEFMQT